MNLSKELSSQERHAERKKVIWQLGTRIFAHAEDRLGSDFTKTTFPRRGEWGFELSSVHTITRWVDRGDGITIRARREEINNSPKRFRRFLGYAASSEITGFDLGLRHGEDEPDPNHFDESIVRWPDGYTQIRATSIGGNTYLHGEKGIEIEHELLLGFKRIAEDLGIGLKGINLPEAHR